MTKKNINSVVPLIPLRDIIIFPHMVVPLFVGRDKSIKALEFAMGNDKNILLAAQKKAKTDDPVSEDIYKMGYARYDPPALEAPRRYGKGAGGG